MFHRQCGCGTLWACGSVWTHLKNNDGQDTVSKSLHQPHPIRYRSMRRVPQLCVASLLYFSLLTAALAERYGDWSVEEHSNSVVTLSFKQPAQVGNQLTTSELAIICEKREDSKFVGAILIPFD